MAKWERNSCPWLPHPRARWYGCIHANDTVQDVGCCLSVWLAAVINDKGPHTIISNYWMRLSMPSWEFCKLDNNPLDLQNSSDPRKAVSRNCFFYSLNIIRLTWSMLSSCLLLTVTQYDDSGYKQIKGRFVQQKFFKQQLSSVNFVSAVFRQ